MKKNNIKNTVKLILYSFLLNSCTNLDEKIWDESNQNNSTAESYLTPVYAKLPDLVLHTNLFNIQEISTDEAILPYRGGTDWGDNGIYMNMHKHDFTSTNPNLNETWDIINTGISRAITALNKIPTTNNIYLAEARAMRAYYCMISLDLFNIVFVKDKPSDASKILKDTKAYDYVRDEFLAALPNLNDDTSNPGRLNKSAVYGLLARLYLNSEVYKSRYVENYNFKQEDLKKVIEYCDMIINSGKFELSKDYFSIFNSDNHNNKEIIFAVDQRAELNGTNRQAYWSLSGDQYPLALFPGANGTDGPAITPDYYETWVTEYGEEPAGKDPRFFKQNMDIYSDPTATCVKAENYRINRGILRGQQYGLIKKNGAFLKCTNGEYLVGKLYNESRSNKNLPVDFTLEVDFGKNTGYSAGYRVEKYEFSQKSDDGRNKGDADIILLRLADIYMMRAEANLRLNNNVSAALSDVNTVRTSRTNHAPALSSITLEKLFTERGFEFYWEMLRRTDMIRFGKYEGSWTEKNNSDKNKRVFPIPQKNIDAASATPGYLVQNQGY